MQKEIYLINVDNNQDIIGIKLNDGFDFLQIYKPRILFKNNFGLALRKLPYFGKDEKVIVKNYNYFYKIEDTFLIDFYYGKVGHDDK